MESGGVVEIRDHVLWAKHIYGDNSLKEKILALKAGTPIHLEVNGVYGSWVKMDDGNDGRPTDGIKPIGEARVIWNSLQVRRGAIVSICEVILANKQGVSHAIVH